MHASRGQSSKIPVIPLRQFAGFQRHLGVGLVASDFDGVGLHALQTERGRRQLSRGRHGDGAQNERGIRRPGGERLLYHDQRGRPPLQGAGQVAHLKDGFLVRQFLQHPRRVT